MRRALLPLLAGVLVLAAVACEPTNPAPKHSPNTKAFGASASPWDVDDWSEKVGAKPNGLLLFEAWSNNRGMDQHFKEALRQGLKSVMVTWEPWAPVPASEGKAAQYAVQPRYANSAIAAGKLDSYIRTFARSVKANPKLTVWIRFGHEMNGDWYPWSHDPAAFVQAWRHAFNIFSQEGVTNDRWVFSVNPNLYQSAAAWKAGVLPYYPGKQYVHAIGSTMIDFGGSKDYSVPMFVDRFKILESTFPKPFYVTEAQTDEVGRVTWLHHLYDWLVSDDASWVVGINLSQYTSRGQAQMTGQVGNLNWRVTDDPASKPMVRQIIHGIT